VCGEEENIIFSGSFYLYKRVFGEPFFHGQCIDHYLGDFD
jgi:hypothetical protein